MKILYLHVTQNFSGVEKRFYTYYKHLDTLNDDNTYSVLLSKTFLSKYAPDLEGLKNVKIVPYSFCWEKTSKLTRYIDYIFITLKFFALNLSRYDIVHAPTTGGRLFMKYIRAKRKVISIVNSIPSQLKIDVTHKVTRELITKHNIEVDCLDENIGNFVKGVYPKNKNQINISPCSFIYYSGLEHDAKKEHSIVFAGRFMEEKGIGILLNQLNDILKRTTYKIYILGRGSLLDKVNETVRKSIARDRVQVGFVKNLTEILERSEVFLSLQKYENYPSQSLLEAMLARNVIIATNVGLTYKIVKPEFGFLIDNPMELTESLQKIELLGSQCSLMGEKAYMFVKHNQSKEEFHKYLLGLYQK